MYSLPYFKENDPAVVTAFIKAYPFAYLGGCSASGEPVATQVPLFADERDGQLYLSGHIMRNTAHQKAFAQNPKVLAVFTGPHTYVSASWYTNQKQGSTWNYMSVQARGEMVFRDEDALIEILRRTTDHFEDNPASGANFKDIPRDYVNHLSAAIVCFEIKVSHIENTFKLSQNRDEQSFDNIINQLELRDANAREIAQQMRMRRSQLFKTTNA